MGFFGTPRGVLAPGNNVVWLSGAVPPTNGVAGTGVGVAGPGSKYTDTNTKTEYHQQGTIANVNWVPYLSP